MKKTSAAVLVAILLGPLCQFGVPAATLSAQDDPGPGGRFEAVQVAPQVTVFVQQEILLYPVQGNIVLIERGQDALVVDSGRTPSWAAAVIAEIRRTTDKPVRYLVNTHWHGDHHHGNSTFLDAFPGLTLVGHAETSREIANQGKRSLEGQIRLMENPQPWLDALQKNDDGRGNPLRPDQRHRIRQMTGMPAQYLEELRQVELTPPAFTYRQGLVLGEGEERVEIFSNGPGNTAADSILYLPGSKIVITGDLLTSTVPFMSGSHPRGWLARLREIGELDFEVIIPGHGLPQRDRRLLDLHIDLLETIIEQAEAAVEAGETLEAFMEGLDLSRFRQAYCGEDDFLIQEFDARVTYAAVPSAYRETLRVRRRQQDSEWTLPLGEAVRTKSEELRAQAASLEIAEGAKALKERVLEDLDRVDSELDADRHLLALYRLGSAWEGLFSAAQAYGRQEDKPEDADAFQSHWSGIKATLESRRQALLDSPAQEKDETLTPLAVRAMADISLMQTLPYVNAAGLYAHSTSVSYGLYALGQGQSHLRWAEWCRGQKVSQGRPQPALRETAAALLADLEQRTGEAFEDPELAIEMHSRFIQLNASLKKAREVLAAEGKTVQPISALLPLLEAEMHLQEILSRQSPLAAAGRHRLQLENWQRRIKASPFDHSLALLFLQRAGEALEAAEENEEPEEELRSAAAILEGVLPAYFTWVKE
ncbi:MAG TPA: MBL fold metallo-hydrolase [Acidobacteriota bacterium]|nr:MBL fold metallo-hydrolase [Acidobacteriota bacterium]